MKDVITWVTTPKKDTRAYVRIDPKRVNQFEQVGYRVIQDDVDFFLIERLKTKRNMICDSMDMAEQIIHTALHLEKNTLQDQEKQPTDRVLTKAMILTGKINYINNLTSKHPQRG